MAELGLFAEETADGATWRGYLGSRLKSNDPRSALRQKLTSSLVDASNVQQIIDAFDHLGLFDEELIVGTVVDALCAKMTERLAYAEGERDMCLLHHEFGVVNQDGSRAKLLSTLQIRGEPYPEGPSSMATTVGVTAAVAARCVLDGTIDRRGVVLPVTPDIYNPILDEMAAEGVEFVERERRPDE